jgi:hypothetical protein
MKFPRAIKHYGIEFVKVTEEDPAGNKFLGYTCKSYPALGTTRSLVSTWNPSPSYLESVMGSIHYNLSQYIADYIRSVEILKKHGKSVSASAFFLQEADTAPYDPEAEEWPETLNHHGIIYWRSVEETVSKDVILKYTCREFPFLGALTLKVDTATPNVKYKTCILANILHHINQFLADYFCFMEDLRIKSKQAPMFDFSDTGTANLLGA